MALPVLLMRPIFVEKLWGGARLRALPAKARAGHAPPDGRIGESWEVADLPEGTSTIDGGPLHGVTLTEAVARHGRALVGPRARVAPDGRLRFPLLVKLIDAADDLSVQVHPGAAYAAAHPGTFAKDEAWLVVDAAPDARILHGLKPEADRAAFERAIADGRADALLREVRPRRGDILHIPPGTQHAIGRGCLLLEVQEPSDTTFRVFDFNRLDKDGKARALHVEQALAVTNFGAQPPAFVARKDGASAALSAAHFSMEPLEVAPALRVGGDDPLVVFALDGDVVLEDAHGTHRLPEGGVCVVPPDARATVTAAQRATVVVMAPR